MLAAITSPIAVFLAVAAPAAVVRKIVRTDLGVGELSLFPGLVVRVGAVDVATGRRDANRFVSRGVRRRNPLRDRQGLGLSGTHRVFR